MTAQIDGYVDCVSPYSYFAFLYLLRNRDTLKSQGVEIDFHPIFLGGVNHGSGNKPPWTLEARAKYLQYDRKRAMLHFDTPKMRAPDNFPMKTIQANRALAYVKAHHSKTVFEAALLNCFRAVWENNEDLADVSIISSVLGRAEGLEAEDVRRAVEASETKQWKDKLAETTKYVLDHGAYGAPWFVVRNKEGVEEPFFGSDRFAFMWRFLGLKWRDVELETVGDGAAGGAKL